MTAFLDTDESSAVLVVKIRLFSAVEVLAVTFSTIEERPVWMIVVAVMDPEEASDSGSERH